MANIARILRNQGPKSQLEYDFARCSMAISLEGWEGLRAFGGNTYFVTRARSLMQADNLDLIGSHDRIKLADVSDVTF